MSWQVSSVKITGTPGDSGWSQVHEFKPDDPEKLARRGHLFAVIAATAQIGREIILRLQEEYFGNLEPSAFYALKNAVGKLIAEFGQDIEVVAAAISGEVVYSVAGGGGRVEIYREGALAKILESTASEVVCASGYPKSGDQIILGTKAFFAGVSAGVIKAALEGPDPEAAGESLASSVHANPDSGDIGCVIIKFTKTVLSVPEATPLTKSKVNAFFKKLAFSLRRALPERQIFVKRTGLDEETSVSRKNTLLVGGILLVLLLVSIGFGVKQMRLRKFKASYQDILNQAKDELVQAQNIAPADPAQARTLFTDSRVKVNELLARKIKDKEVQDLAAKVSAKESEIMGIYRISSLDLYLDLSLLSSGFKGEKLITSGENLYVLDKAGKKVVGIVLATKKTNILAGPDQADGILDILAYENDVYGVFGDGIYLLGDKKEKEITADWQGEILASAYAGNIYVLEKGAGVIWRYSGSGSTFGTKQNWLAVGTKPNFMSAKQMLIDGAVWVLKEPFDIAKFSLGSPQGFNPKGVSPEISTAVAIYSNEDDKYLYVLEPEQKRIVVLEKNGTYKGQYLADGSIGQATGLVVSEKDKKIILLSGDKLYWLEVKHL